MRLALTFLLLAALRLGAVEWPIIGAEVETNGWVLRLTLSTSPDLGTAAAVTNLALFNGLGPQNKLSQSNSLRLDLTRMGYDSGANPIQVGRSRYATRLLRLPYPMQQTNDIIAENVTNVVVRLALDDWISSRDSNITMTARSGAVASTNLSAFTNSASVTGFTVTNSSVQPYSKVIFNWTQPAYYRINGTFTLRATGGHGDAQNGGEVAAVKFWSMDGHGIAVTQVVAQSSIDRTMPDAVPFEEYIATLSTASFTVGDLVTNHFQAFPWEGDSSSVCDTSDGVNGIETPYHRPCVLYYDNRPISCAVVSTTNNSGAAGVVTTNFNSSAPPLAFASISQAAKALADTNSLLFSHNDASGIIYVRGGQHSFIGTAGGHPTTRPNEWLVLTNFPGDGIVNCEIQNGTGSGDIQDRVAFRGLYLTLNEAFPIAACSNLWFDQCIFHTTNSSGDMIDGTTFVFMTDNIVTNLDQGFSHQGAQNQIFALVRGNTIGGLFPRMHGYTTVGNYVSVTNVLNALISSASTSIPKPLEESIVFNNKFMKLNYSGSTLASFWSGITNLTNGSFISQNIFENVRSNTPGTLLFVFADSTKGFSTNVIMHNNVVVGERTSHGYDSINTVSHARHLWSYRNNFFMDDNTKHDTFSGDTDGAQGARTGGWPVLYGVNYSNNFNNEQTNSAAGGSFINEFYGIGSFQPSRNAGTADPPGCQPGPIRFPRFVNDQSHTNLAIAYIAEGNGDYRYQTAAPAFIGRGKQCLRFDIDGKSRSAIDPPGAYVAGNAKKGAFF